MTDSTTQPSSLNGKLVDQPSWAGDQREARGAISVILFSLALVLFMAAILFLFVGFNPKNDSYGGLPWIYAVASLVGGGICGFLSRRLDWHHSTASRD
jgi:hypothetical protein